MSRNKRKRETFRLDAELYRLVEKAVENGEYRNKSEIYRRGIRKELGLRPLYREND